MPIFLNIMAVLVAGAPVSASPTDGPQAAANAITAPPRRVFGSARTADDAELGTATAREDVSIVAQSEQTSTVSRSSVSGTVTTGETSFAGNAFQNASGFTLINANTGNNVAMNSSINVNIVITPPQ